MSLYKDASLVMIPSAYKDGKLYSIRPTDGSGDFTFSRGSNLAATRVDVNGLIEKGRENLLLQSNQFDTTWTIVNFGSVTSGQAGYDGSSDAWLYTKTGDGSRLQQVVSASGVQTYSIYVKAGASNWVRFLITASTSNQARYFDLSSGTKGSSIYGGEIESTITSVGNDWYRITLTFNETTTGVRLYPAQADGDTSGTSGSIYIQDAQLEAGLVATDYIETGASTAQAGILEDMPRLDYSGGASCPALLLEPQRSNILSHSEYLPTGMSFARSTFTNNDAISPEGLANATKWQMTSDTGSHYLRKGFTTSDTYSVSVFAKKGNYRYLGLRSGSTLIGFDFDTETFVGGTGTKEAFGDGWWRLSVTATGSGFSYFGIHYSNASGGEQTTADGTEYYHIYGMQIEQASYPTSYIPTYGSSVTRSYDNSSLGGLQTSSILNGTKGTLLFEGIKKQDWYFSNFVITTDGSNTNRSLLIDNSGSVIRLRVWNASSSIDATIFTTSLSNGTFKYLIRWDNGNLAVFVNGASVGSATINAYSYTTINLKEGTFSNNLVNQVLTFPTALTDNECIALTTI